MPMPPELNLQGLVHIPVTYCDRPQNGNALVKSGRTTVCYSHGNQAFYAARDIYLIDTTWIYKISWENNTDATQTYSLKYSITVGSEVTASVGMGAANEGLSISMDVSTKVFSSKTITLNFPPKSRLTFYQGKYRFRDTMFFVLDAWNAEWNAGSKECEVEIMSEDYLTTDIILDSSTLGTMTASTVPRSDPSDLEIRRATQKRENLTE
ncbi:hypothetical protein F5146DRAFT_1113084 [Armillaria mellea]|nr:hypothetical protein F5146DRAFT_1113084 [Armillaria mellea]